MLQPHADAAATTITTAFPVVLYDGDRETDVGNISIHPDLVFKQFQTTLSQMIGISYNNLTTYLVDSTKSKISPDRRKILITGKVNFAVIVRETNCYFLVVLKRSRRDRRRKPNKQSDFDFALSPSVSGLNTHNRDHSLYCYEDYTHNRDHSVYYYEDRFQELLMQREKYMNLILSHGFDGFDPRLSVNLPRVEDTYPTVQVQVQSVASNLSRSFCEECSLALMQGKVAEFHLCVYDEVVVGGFRSTAGPVSRPV